MNIDLVKYMLYLGFIHIDTNGDLRKYEFDNTELKIVISYMKNKEGYCLIPYSVTEKITKSFEKATSQTEEAIIKLLDNHFEKSLDRFKLYEQRKLKIKKLLGS